jgi:phosphotransferase system enzyme I (PtsI)
MEIKKGISVSPGVVIATAVVLDAEDLVVPRRHVDAGQAAKEIQRLGDAIAQAVVDLTKLRDEVSAAHGKEIGGIFDVHLGLLRDKSLVSHVVGEIQTQQTTAEYAVSLAMRRYRAKFGQMADRYMADRVKDIDDIEKRLLRVLIGQRHLDLAHLEPARSWVDRPRPA